MLAYLLDSGSGPVCTLVPLSGWAVFISGILIGYGPIVTVEDGMSVFIQSIPYNFYGWIALILAGIIGYQILPNFGPMRKAEQRALKQGKVLRDGAVPLTGKEMAISATNHIGISSSGASQPKATAPESLPLA